MYSCKYNNEFSRYKVGEVKMKKTLKVNKNKSGSGSISNRIILPAFWVKELGIEDTVKACYDEENKRIILTKD